MMIDVFPFSFGRSDHFGHTAIALPSLLSADDVYAFEASVVNESYPLEKGYIRELITSDGRKWKSVQWLYRINKDMPNERPIQKVDGFLVASEDYPELDISKKTVSDLKSNLRPHYEAFMGRSIGDGGKPIIISESLKLPTGQQGADIPLKELSSFSIQDEISSLRGAQKKTANPKFQSKQEPPSRMKFGKVLAVTLGIAAVAGISWVLLEQLRNKSPEQSTPQR